MNSQVNDVYARIQERVYGHMDGHAIEYAMAESAVALQKVSWRWDLILKASYWRMEMQSCANIHSVKAVQNLLQERTELRL